MDFGVGSIVWVRRRNGLRWPSQILDTDDHSASHLTSPRSGAPVKLLDREDASMDWYNLEKPKCVKAFRCGEFDDCVEKVESEEGITLKKKKKNARREDAILHALKNFQLMKVLRLFQVVVFALGVHSKRIIKISGQKNGQMRD